MERPDAEVLDAVVSVQGVQGRALAQRPARQPTGVAARAARTTREKPGLCLGRKRGQAQE